MHLFSGFILFQFFPYLFSFNSALLAEKPKDPDPLEQAAKTRCFRCLFAVFLILYFLYFLSHAFFHACSKALVFLSFCVHFNLADFFCADLFADGVDKLIQRFLSLVS